MPRCHHQKSTEHRHRCDRLKKALRASSSREAMALRSRMARCAGPDWGHRFTCRSPACPACRDRYIAKQRRAAFTRFAGVPTQEMANFALILPPVFHVADIEAVMAKVRRDLRNLLDRERRASGLWWSVEVLVWLETDAFDLEDFARLGSDKQKQIGQFIQAFHGQSGTVWVPTLHGVVRLGPGLDVGIARAAFEKQWPGHRRVHIQTFTEGKAMTASLGDVINYSLKHECTNEFIDRETGEVVPVEWETSLLRDYYSWMYGWSRGFQSTRISVKPKTEKIKSDQALDSMPDSEEFDVNRADSITGEHYSVLDPLPLIYSFSVFDRDYRY
jgi:hypothetical protein